MRAVGLAAILLGVLAMLYPYYAEWVPIISMTRNDSLLVGGLLVAVGGLTLAIHRS